MRKASIFKVKISNFCSKFITIIIKDVKVLILYNLFTFSSI